MSIFSGLRSISVGASSHLLALVVCVGCSASGENPNDDGAGGHQASGGASGNSGGANSGGANSGGTTTLPAQGGATNSGFGGASAQGGSAGSNSQSHGGSTGQGGTTTGGQQNTGQGGTGNAQGGSSSGGQQGNGGTLGAGGKVGSGGAPGNGGQSQGNGGQSQGNGGQSQGNGGTPGAGGKVGSGGTPGNGGQSQGNGGAPGNGGMTGMGGSSNGSCSSAMGNGTCPAKQCPAGATDCGCYNVANLGARKKVILDAGGDSRFIASAMVETENLGTDYPYGDNKTGDAFNAGCAKQNWYMIRQAHSAWSNLGSGSYATAAAMNTDLKLDITVYNESRAKWDDNHWFAGHRNGQTGLQTGQAPNLQLFIDAYNWTKKNLENGHMCDNVRFWVTVPAIIVE